MEPPVGAITLLPPVVALLPPVGLEPPLEFWGGIPPVEPVPGCSGTDELQA
jgi:hypothetical protein